MRRLKSNEDGKAATHAPPPPCSSQIANRSTSPASIPRTLSVCQPLAHPLSRLATLTLLSCLIFSLCFFLSGSTTSETSISIERQPTRRNSTSMARVFADVNANMPRSYWDYDSVNIQWGVLENYEVVRKIGTFHQNSPPVPLADSYFRPWKVLGSL